MLQGGPIPKKPKYAPPPAPSSRKKKPNADHYHCHPGGRPSGSTRLTPLEQTIVTAFNRHCVALEEIGADDPLITAAAHTLAGSCVGVGTALACGAPAADIGAGLWGFNPALTALAVSVFFVPNASSYALATGGACATSLIFGGVKGTMAGVAGVPALTLPFCAAAIGCHLLGQSGAMGLALAASPHSPERNRPA